MDEITNENIILLLNLKKDDNLKIKNNKLSICDENDIEKIDDDIESTIYIIINYVYSLINVYNGNVFFSEEYNKYLSLLSASVKLIKNIRTNFNIRIDSILYESLDEFEYKIKCELKSNENSCNNKMYKIMEKILNPIYIIVMDLRERYIIKDYKNMLLYMDTDVESTEEEQESTEEEQESTEEEQESTEQESTEQESTEQDISYSYFNLW